jgi:hypothetical protein
LRLEDGDKPHPYIVFGREDGDKPHPYIGYCREDGDKPHPYIVFRREDGLSEVVFPIMCKKERYL